MDLEILLKDKSIKPKAKTEAISQRLLDGTLSIESLISVAKSAKDPDKGTCIEALEYATQTRAAIATEECLSFVSATLAEKAPRVKWESARVVANIAASFPDNLDEAIKNLLLNSEHSGTVVRWSAALTLGEILKLKTSHHANLIPALKPSATGRRKTASRRFIKRHLKNPKLRRDFLRLKLMNHPNV